MLNVSAYYSTVAEGSILILAVLGELRSESALVRHLPNAVRAMSARAQGRLPGSARREAAC